MVRYLKPILFVWVCSYWVCGTNALPKLRTAYYFRASNYTSVSRKDMPYNSRARICCTIEHKGELSCCGETNDHIKYFGELTGQMVLFCTAFNQSTSEYEQKKRLQYHVVSVEPSELPVQAEILYPEFGEIVSNHLRVDLQTYISLHDQLLLEVAGLPDTIIPSTMQTIESQDNSVEPGSWFYSVTPLSTLSGHSRYGIPSVGYMEFTPDETEIQNMRLYVNRTIDNTPAQKYKDVSLTSNLPKKICFFSGNTMDGLRSVWLQQSEFMDSSRFAFTWLLAPEEPSVQKLAYSLRTALLNLQNYNKNVFIQDTVSFMLQRDDLFDTPDDGSPCAEDMWAGNTTNLYLYAHERYVIAEGNIDSISPAWCKRMYENMRGSLVSAGCKVAVFGNDRHFGSNVVIIDTARSLRIPSVGELSNHFVHPFTVPSVLIAPSEFAARHHSIQDLLNNSNSSVEMDGEVNFTKPKNIDVKVVVISPSVNTDVLRPLSAEEKKSAEVRNSNSIYRHPSCIVTGVAPTGHSPCVVIGFLARLSKEKSPGLFLQMAYEILQQYPFARFIIIGDGPLRTPLENLADRLQIHWAVHFTGWVSTAELPQLLRGIDIVVNPFLWPETFCIANIEAMSMGVPLVTFAVGGIGEYVQDPAWSHSDMDNGQGTRQIIYNCTETKSTSVKESNDPRCGDFEVSGNAVVVHRATPAALAGAALHLIQRPILRRALGARGRQMVLDHFRVDRQMRQYAELYDAILKR